MKHLRTFILLPALLFCIHSVSFSQQAENWLEKDQTVNYAKLYLHTDREFYFSGDSIWFKAYYLDGQTQQFIDGFYNLYVDLAGSEGNIVYNEVLPLSFGVSSGNINISPELKAGNYILRAYTDFQKQIGEDAFFHKRLKISEVKSSIELEKDQLLTQNEEPGKIDIAFLPEGGALLSNHFNIVGIKAIDENGMGIDVKGQVFDNNRKAVASFETVYKGLGKLYFNPQPEETYTVKIEGIPEFTYTFDQIKTSGIKLELVSKLKDELIFRSVTNADQFLGKDYYFALMHKAKALYYQKIIQNEAETYFKLNQDELPGGINRIVLLDDQFRPISERLIFSPNYEINRLRVRTDKDNYSTRSEITLDIYDGDNLNSDVYSNLSVSVIDESMVRAKGNSLDILSYLLLDSELKGNIEAPSDFFIDEENISSEAKLNLLMLTQGWSTYTWNEIAEKGNLNYDNQAHGITIKGKIQQLLGKKPVVNGEVTLGLFKGESLRAYSGVTDEDGRFSIDSVLFTDTASVFVQARNKKGKLNTQVFLDPVFDKPVDVSKNYLPTEKINTELSIKALRQKYYANLALIEFKPEEGAIMLEEVYVKADKIVKEEPFNYYGKARISLDVKEIDESYTNVLSYLEGRVTGLILLYDRLGHPQIFIASLMSSTKESESPMFLLDGVPMSDPFYDLRNLSMRIIEKVDVLKSPDEIAIFGVRGAKGVIAITTKSGKDIIKENEYNKGIIYQKIIGYAPYKEFYSPKYFLENIDNKKPDNRLTLYWNPNVLTQNGKTTMSFFTSDDISNFRVFVEGMTNDGRICLGTADFSVNEYNPEILN